MEGGRGGVGKGREGERDDEEGKEKERDRGRGFLLCHLASFLVSIFWHALGKICGYQASKGTTSELITGSHYSQAAQWMKQCHG